MKNIYKNYLIVGLTVLVVLLLVIIILLVLNKPSFSFLNHSSKSDSSEVNEKDVKPNTPNDNTNNTNSSNTEEPTNTNNSNTNNNDNNSINNSNSNSTNGNTSSNSSSSSQNNTTSNIASEEDVITYFQSEENQYGSSYNNQDNATLREKAKNGFITIVDFIFYGKEIKGYTFEGLTNTAKLKIIQIALTIDHKIEEYFPNYKTIIKDKYNDIKGKLAVKYLELTASLCDSVGEDTCNQFKEDFSNMKESFGFTWSLIKELATSGKNKVKDYYENEFRTN